MIEFPGLATVTVSQIDGDVVRIGYVRSQSGAEAGVEPNVMLTVEAFGEERYIGANSLDTSGPSWRGLSWPDDRPVEVRTTSEDDAVVALSLQGDLGVPLPIPLIEAIHRSEGVFTMPTIWALSDDQGYVVTLMLSSDQGLYLRLSGAWHLLTEEDVIDGLNVTSVEGAALDMFDQFDRAGQLVAVAAMPLSNPMDIDTIPGVASEPAGTATAVIAATMTRTMPVLGTAEDLPDAIAAAEDDPDIQWWVERRARALGIEADFPWAS